MNPFAGHVVLPGAESLRVEFDRQCSTEKRHDPLTLSDGVGRILAIRSGRDWADWSQEVRVQGFISFSICFLMHYTRDIFR